MPCLQEMRRYDKPEVKVINRGYYMSALVPVPFEFIRNGLRKRDTMRGLPNILLYIFAMHLVNSIIQEHECYMTHKINFAPNIRDVVIHNNQINFTYCDKIKGS